MDALLSLSSSIPSDGPCACSSWRSIIGLTRVWYGSATVMYSLGGETEMGPTFSLALTLALTVLLITFFINRQFYLAADEDEGAILVLGDSWASLSGSFLADVCSLGLEGSGSTSSGKPLTNNGKSGPTAQQWVPGEKAVNSFEKAKYDRDYVWLSIGGNDFNCNVGTHDAIANNMLSVISDIFESSNRPAMMTYRCCTPGMGTPVKTFTEAAMMSMWHQYLKTYQRLSWIRSRRLSMQIR